MNMKYKQYSPETWARIEASIDRALAQDSAPVAAFDADGTLWDTDLGEGFFRYKIDRKLVSLPEDPWNYYVQLKKKNGDPREAYLWLAQILKGQTRDQAQTWAKEAVESSHPLPIFPEQQKLIHLLKSKGVQVYIVTASIKWAVEPGSHALGLTHDDVIGIEVQTPDGTVSDQVKGIITHREGKPQALLNATGGKKPFLCAGNTMGDLELLEASTDLRIAVSASTPDDKLYKTEIELQELAKKRGWIAHRFVEGAG
jgi:phosphoserine phosphatase